MGPVEPYEVRERVLYQGRRYIVTAKAPNADGWRYRGTPVDLVGPSVTFSHDEALRIRPTAKPVPAPEPLPDVVEEVLDPWHDILDAIASEIRAGVATPRLHGAFITYMESA